MSFKFKNLSISKISIIGTGQIGPDIGLYFSKVFAKHDVELILVDIAEEALAKAKIRIEKKIQKGLKTGAFKPAQAEAMKNSFLYTSDYKQILGSNIVIEAATEDEKIKRVIFSQIEKICDDNCIFLSNSSHMRPEDIFKNVVNKNRCLVAHYFFPAERNPVIEIVPSEYTSPEITNLLMGFYEAIGKVPIKVKSSYGYAIDPIFEGLCQTAILCLEKGYGTVKEIDSIAQKSLGLSVGPFTALTLTGGNPITSHGLEEMNHRLMPWFKAPHLLKKVVKDKTNWEIASRNENVVVSPEQKNLIEDQFLGAYFALSSYILDLKICSINDLNMACEIALAINPPFEMMNNIGINKAYRLVETFCAKHSKFSIPKSLKEALAQGSWQLSSITKTVLEKVAVFKIRRPKVLNALNLKVITELESVLIKAENDPSIIGSIITGFGNKAFVSGADISMLTALKTPEDGYQNARRFQRVFDRIERMKKPVICAMNGFAFGGGNELAMSCAMRICKKDLPVLISQPEVKLGFIPGAGGTQRLPRIVGLNRGAEILRTGRTVSSKEAVKIGLIHKEVEGDLIEKGVALVIDLFTGRLKAVPINKMPLRKVQEIPNVNIGGLSQKIDSIISKTIYEGSKMTLEDGVVFEAQQFAECMKTEDMKIGLENFNAHGPKVGAKFVHR